MTPSSPGAWSSARRRFRACVPGLSSAPQRLQNGERGPRPIRGGCVATPNSPSALPPGLTRSAAASLAALVLRGLGRLRGLLRLLRLLLRRRGLRRLHGLLRRLSVLYRLDRLLRLYRLHGLLRLHRRRSLLRLSAAKHATSGVADAPDGLADTLAYAADRLTQSLAETANRLAEAIRQPAEQTTTARLLLLRLDRLLRRDLLYGLLWNHLLHWLLRNGLLHRLLHGLLWNRLLHGLLHGLLRRLLRRSGLLRRLDYLLRLRALSGLLRRLLDCLLRLVHLIRGHTLRVGVALGVTLIRHAFLLARLRSYISPGEAHGGLWRTPMDSHGLRNGLQDACAPCSNLRHQNGSASSMPAAVWPRRSPHQLAPAGIWTSVAAPILDRRLWVAHFLRLTQECIWAGHRMALDGIGWPVAPPNARPRVTQFTTIQSPPWGRRLAHRRREAQRSDNGGKARRKGRIAW